MDKVGGIIATVDIGTTNIKMIIAKVNKFNKLEIIHIETIPVTDIKNGEIVEAYKIAETVKKMISKVELESNIKIKSCYVNVPNKYVLVEDVMQEVDINEKLRTVQKYDIDKLLNKLRDSEVTSDKKIIDIVPLEYYDDNNNIVKSPIYFTTTKLKLKAQVFIASREYIEKLEAIFQYSSIKVDGYIPQALANAKLVLNDEDMNEGTLLLDVGGNVTDISIFFDNKLIFIESLDVGGDNISKDIALVLDINMQLADKLKKEYPLALKRFIDREILVNITKNDYTSEQVKTSKIVEIIEARCEDTAKVIDQMLQEADAKKYVNKVVIIGQGFNTINKIDVLVNRIFGKVVKLVNYKNTNQIKPVHTTAYAMQEYVLYNNTNMNSNISNITENEEEKNESFIHKAIEKVKDFLYT